MASSSASTIQKSFKYDVFLSFRGEDTRKTFVDHLYHALTQKGIITYKDDEEIKKGERISDELIRSIEDSKFYIIVFSKNYASSSWCLEELVKIMECQETNEHTAYPIFYDVEPTEVRKQSGTVEEAFSKHKEKEAAEKWREALREAADLAGWELKNTFDGHESKLIQQIVEEISLELRFINSSLDEKLVGMETRVQDVVSSLEIDLDKVVRMIGIWGMGGAGKTTLARAVFDQISYRFEGSSFVENVRENSKNQLGGLKSLQKQILSDVLNDPHVTVKGVSDMKKMMCGRKVLVVLDDVDHRDQLEALAGAPSWFKSGSRVIITTREKQVLEAHDMPENLILGAYLFSDEEANCLFNKYAFGRVIPNQGYEKLSGQVVRYAAGLPLTIKVLGSFLRGKDELEWIDALARLKTIPLTETLDKLELSYESLEYDQKEIFLDVACILKGWMKEEAIIALESCRFHARIGLRVLEQKCLITVSLGQLRMHDHIEEMGKHIVRRLHPYEPHRHSRLWIQEEIEDILVKDKGTEAINCIKMFFVNLSVAKKGLQKMGKLRSLYLNALSLDKYRECHDMSEDKMCLPNGLRYLSLSNYPFTCFPYANFQPDNLVGLNIKYSNLEHWEGGEKVTKNLRFIELYYCQLKSLNIGLNMNIERLHLKRCKHLVELHMPVESLKLKSLHLSSCKLKTLNLKGAQNLETLDLIACEDLEELHMPIECLKLKCFHLNCPKLKKLKLPSAFNLEMLHLNQCKELNELYVPVEFKIKSFSINHSKLRTLDISSTQNLDKLNVNVCFHLVDLQMPFEGLKFRSLHLYSVKLKTLNLKGTQNLETLDLEQCEDLAELHMPVESQNLNRICIRHTKLKILNLKGTRNLETLYLEKCEDLVELHMPDESLNLNRICIRHTKLKILNLKGTRNLETLDLEQCEDLVELNMPDESLNLNRICIRRTKLKILNFKGTRNLKMLDLKHCEDLVELHMPDESLNLNRICIRHTKLKILNLKGTQNLVTLDLEQCEDLVELHMPKESLNLYRICIRHSKLKILNLKGTRNLETLDLKQCEDLVELHMPDESLSLNRIYIPYTKLKILNLKGTRNFETLDLDQCGDLVELHMPDENLNLERICIRHSKLKILNLKGTRNLKTLDLKQCEDLVELHMPDESPNLYRICIRHSKLKILNLKGTRNLKTLDLEQCEDLVELHMPDESLNLNWICIRHTKLKTLNLKEFWNLETLDLEQCNDLVELHMPDESLNLKWICIRHTKLKILNLMGTRNLETLDLEQCEDLVELHMPDESSKLESINICCSKLRTVDLELTAQLDLEDCSDLVEAHAPVGRPKKLVCINLGGCVRVTLVNQGFPKVDSTSELSLTAHSLATSSLHHDINLPKFQLHCVYNESLLSPSGNLRRLISFGNCACTNLASSPGSISLRSICRLQCLNKLTLEGFIPEVPKELDQLECLEELTLSLTKIKHLPDSICMLKHLKLLRFKSCWFLEQLPEDLGRLECLEELYLTECIFLRGIPNSICEAKRLKCFHLPHCVLVEKLPQEIGRLKCLQELNIEGTGISHLPLSTFQLTGLRILGFMWQLKLYGFTSVTQISEYMGFCYI